MAKNKGGRPKGSDTYTDEKAAEICEAMVEGVSAKRACEKAGVALRTFYLWQRNRPEFAALVSRAREDQADTFADEMCDLADTEEDVQRAKLKIDARKWIASRMKPKSWGDRMQVEQTTKLEETSTEDLIAELKSQLEGSDLNLKELLK